MILDFAFVNPVAVRTYTGGDNYGDTFADPVTVDCWVEDVQHLVTGSDGEQITAATLVYGPLAQVDAFTVQSLASTTTDRWQQVITVDRFDSGALSIGLDHFVAHLR